MKTLVCMALHSLTALETSYEDIWFAWPCMALLIEGGQVVNSEASPIIARWIVGGLDMVRGAPSVGAMKYANASASGACKKVSKRQQNWPQYHAVHLMALPIADPWLHPLSRLRSVRECPGHRVCHRLAIPWKIGKVQSPHRKPMRRVSLGRNLHDHCRTSCCRHWHHCPSHLCEFSKMLSQQQVCCWKGGVRSIPRLSVTRDLRIPPYG